MNYFIGTDVGTTGAKTVLMDEKGHVPGTFSSEYRMYAKSLLWRSILADLFNTEMITLTCTEGAPFGAAIIAAVGAGYYKNVIEACDSILKTESAVEPDPSNTHLYNEYYKIYRGLYPSLKNTFHKISLETDKHYGS